MGVVVQHCTAHWNERLTIDGKLSVAKIVSQHPTLAELFEEGLDFYVWKAEAEVEFPELPDLAQRALNAKHSVQQGQDIFQVFLRAVACWQSGVVDGKADKSLWIVRDIMKANPKCTPAECESMVEIARKFGGSSPTMISQVRLFLSTFKQPGQTVPAATLQAMANLKLAPEEMCPLFMTSILMLLASAPLHVITGGDIKSIMSKKDSKIPTMQLVEPMIKSMIDLSETMDVPSDVAAKIVGEFRTTLVLKFFQKVKKLDDDTFEVLASKVFSKMLLMARLLWRTLGLVVAVATARVKRPKARLRTLTMTQPINRRCQHLRMSSSIEMARPQVSMSRSSTRRALRRENWSS